MPTFGPFVVLLGQDRVDEAGQESRPGKGPHDVGAAADLADSGLLDQIWRQSLRRSATAGHLAGCRR